MRGQRCFSIRAVTLVVGLFLASPPAAVAAEDAKPGFATADCWFIIPDERQAECGYLTVPEDRAKPEGRQVRLPIAIIKATGQRQADPVVFLTGGPGQGVGLDKEEIESWFKINKHWEWMKSRDLILFEQRGTGMAEPSLNCDEIEERGLELIQVMQDEAKVRQIYVEALEQCRTRLAGEGIDLARYSTRDTAADLADLRRALGIKQWNLMGVSYGTRLALAVMRDHPDGIRSVILDSPYPPEIRAYESQHAGVEAAFEKLFRACRRNNYCRFQYPELERSLFKTIAWLNTRPLPVTVADPRDGRQVRVHVTGDTLIELTRFALAFSDARYALPQYLDAVSLVDPSVLEPMMSNMVESSLGLGLGNFSEGKYYTVECNEEIPFNDAEKVKQDAARHRRFAGFAYELDDMDVCSHWLIGAPDEALKAPIKSDIPTLVLSGELDPITPVEFGQVTASRLDNGHLMRIVGVGHSVLTNSECAAEAAHAFLRNPNAKPKEKCAD